MFMFSITSRYALVLNWPLIQWVPGDVSLGVKRQGREADHSPALNAEVKKEGAIFSLLSMSSWLGA
jgi:hypothetical protein